MEPGDGKGVDNKLFTSIIQMLSNSGMICYTQHQKRDLDLKCHTMADKQTKARYAAMRARIWILQDNSMDSSTRTEHETTVTRLDNIQEIVSTIDSNL